MNKKRVPSWLIAVVVAFLIGAFGVSGYKVVTIYLSNAQADDEYEDLKALVGREEKPEATVEPTAEPAPTAEAAATNTSERVVVVLAEPINPATQTTEEVQTPVSPTPEPLIQMDFEPLLTINEDAVGWIYAEDTVIDYPIVQGDDNVFYLAHLFSGSWGFAGTIFMDVDNIPDFSDMNTVIYGHNLKNGEMFASLSNYRGQAYYDEHPVMYLYTPTGDYRVELFSGYARDASLMPHDFDLPEEFTAYVDEITRLSNFQTDVVVGPEDRILTLVTCSYVTDNARYVVHGKLVPLYEEEQEAN